MTMKSTIQHREYDKFRDASGTLSKVAVSVEQDASNAIPVYIVDDTSSGGEVKNIYDEQLSVAIGVETDLVTYTVPVGKRFDIKLVEFDGENIATFRLKVDGTVIAKKRTYFTQYNGDMPFSAPGLFGYEVTAGQQIKLTVEHNRSSVADFNGRILGVEQ